MNGNVLNSIARAIPRPEECEDSQCPHLPAGVVAIDCPRCDGSGRIFERDLDSIDPGRLVRICEHATHSGDTARKVRFLDSLPGPLAATVRRVRNIGAYRILGQEWRPETDPPCLCLGGRPGTGKTVAGIRAALNMIGRYHFRAAYISTDQIATAVPLMFDDPERKQFVRQAVEDCRDERAIVVLDDVGRERATESTTEWVAACVRGMAESRSPGVITTNISGAAIAKRYGEDVSSRLGDRNWIKQISVGGVDLRKGTAQ